MTETEYKKLIVIGGGPAGLAAATAANKNGIDVSDILIIERDSRLGGILNQCIHAGFGLTLFGEEMTGPEYAGRFIDEVNSLGIPYITDSMVLNVSADRVVTFVSPKLGFVKMHSDAVILAMGCRERSRGALNIPGTRPAGIYSAGTAQRYVNIDGKMVGKKVVILGSGDIGLIMARRLTLEGAKVLRVCEIMPYSSGLARNIAQCLDDFGIPLYLSHTVTEIKGRDRVEGVVISEVDGNRHPILGTEEYVECDTLLLSVGLIPENELTVGAGITIDRVTNGAVVNQYMETDIPGIFACGNVLQVHDLVDFVTMEAYRTGKAAADFINGKSEYDRKNYVLTQGINGVRYIVPQKLIRGDITGTKLFFRVDNTYKNCNVVIKADGNEIKRVKKSVVTPGEMVNIELGDDLAEIINDSQKITVEIERI